MWLPQCPKALGLHGVSGLMSWFFLQTMTNLRKEVCGLFTKSFQMLPPGPRYSIPSGDDATKPGCEMARHFQSLLMSICCGQGAALRCECGQNKANQTTQHGPVRCSQVFPSAGQREAGARGALAEGCGWRDRAGAL